MFTKVLCLAYAPYGHIGNMHQHTCPWVAIQCDLHQESQEWLNGLQDKGMDRHCYILDAEGIHAKWSLCTPSGGKGTHENMLKLVWLLSCVKPRAGPL